MNNFSDKPGFLSYKVNIGLLTENYHIPKVVVQKRVRPKNGVYSIFKFDKNLDFRQNFDYFRKSSFLSRNSKLLS